MEDIEQQAIRLEQEFESFGPRNADKLRPQVDRLMESLRQKGLPVPAGLRRIQSSLKLDAEDDFFDNMPV